MAIPFDGVALRKPRVAASNSPFTAEGDVFVRQQDRSVYLSAFPDNVNAVSTEYLVQIEETADLVVASGVTENATQVSDFVYQFNSEGRAIESVSNVTPTPDEVDARSGLVRYNTDPGPTVVVTYVPARLKINWAKNDTASRFGFDDRVQRWTPLPGAAPESIGQLPDTDSGSSPLSLPVVEEGVDPLLVVGSPDQLAGTVVPVPSSNQLTDDQFQNYLDGTTPVPAGEAVLNVESGALLFATDLVTNFLAQSVFYYRTSFFGYDESTGAIGEVGDTLYLNPIPLTTEAPRLRINYRTYLRGEQSTSLTTPSAGFDYVWNPDNGRIYLSASLASSFDAETVYYDGVFSNTGPVESYSHTALGTIEDADSFTTAGITPIDFATYDEAGIILYVAETGLALETLRLVDSTADFTDSLRLRANEAEVVSGTGEVQLSLTFRSANAGNTLTVGTTDFPIEEGISFRLKRSPLDPTNERGLPDGRGIIRVANEILSDSLPQGPSFLLNQLPLQDIAGYDDNTFFRLQNGPVRRLLAPDEDVIYDFDNRQLLWLEAGQHSEVISRETFTIQLPDQVLHDAGFSFELNEGDGFQTLEDGEDVIVDLAAGRLTLIDTQGATLFEDVGTLSATDTLQAATADFSTLSVGSGINRPLLLVGEDAYRIESSTATTVTVDRDIEITGTSTEFSIIGAAEVVYRTGLAEADLRERTVFPYVVADAGQLAPDAESLEFYNTSTLSAEALVTLEAEVLGEIASTLPIPAYFQAAEANYQLFLEETELTFSGGAPASGEYGITGTDFTFNASDVADLAGTGVILDPQLSTGRATGPVEVLASSREIGLPADLSASDIEVRALVSEDKYTQNGAVIFFDKPFRSGQRLYVEYTDTNGSLQQEEVGFRTQEDLGNIGSGATSTFAAGRIPDTNRPAQLLVNGARSTNTVDLPSKTVDLSGIRTQRKVQVSYFALDAVGGESTVSLLRQPLTPPVTFVEGATQTFGGDHTGVLVSGALLLADDQSFEVQSASYDAGSNVTTTDLSPPVREELNDPQVLVSSRGIEERDSFTADVDLNSVGESELRLFGDLTETVGQARVIYLDGDPYYIQSAQFDSNNAITRIILSGGLMREYDGPSLELSRYRVYGVGTQVLLTDLLGLPDLPLQLVRYDASGGTVIDPQGYTFEAGGRILLEPTLTEPPKTDEVWYFAYTGLRATGPTQIAGQTYLPRFRATYRKRTNATQQNGIFGAILRASYDFYSPDTFYFRAVRMDEFALEVSDYLARQARNRASSGGAVVSTASGQNLNEKGNTSLTYDEGTLRDRDRAARVFLEFYNDVIAKFEQVLEVVDGRVVGDRDGKFLFRLRNDDTVGGIDPVTGELIPYYANPENPGTKPTSADIENIRALSDQIGAVGNFIDDLVMVSRKPFELDLGIPLSFEYKGTFRPVWKPSRLSRVYPQQKQTFTVTAPQVDGKANYEFPDDFLRILADPQQDAILSLENIRKRSAKARVRLDGKVDQGAGVFRIRVASEYDATTGEFSNTTYNPTTANPPNFTPPFEVGDAVNLGRVTFSESGGIVTEVTTIYAENLVVSAVGTDYVDVENSPESGNPDFSDLEFGDISAVTPLKGDTLYTVPKVADSGFSLGDSTPPFYRTPLDLAVNADEGELTNTTLPSFVAGLIGQSPIEPLSFLEMTVNYRSQLVEPFRSPALDGGIVDDDGDQKPPFVTPFQDSEIQRIDAELITNQAVEDTDEGSVLNGTIVDHDTINVATDLTAISNPPDEFDLVVIEGDVDGADSIEYRIADVTATTVKLATFYTPSTANVTLDSITSGTGVRDVFNNQRWNDNLGTDFSSFSSVTIATLFIDNGAGGEDSYSVTGFFSGFLQVSSPIAQAGPASYRLEVSVAGANIPATLDQLNYAGVDFSSATGQVTVTGAGPNNVTLDAAGGAVGSLDLQLITAGFGPSVVLGISNSSVVASGTGSVDSGSITMQTANSIAGVVPGQTLLVSSSTTNAGRYTVASVATGTPNTITIEESFFEPLGDSGTATYPMNWRVTQPRRFSPQIEALNAELIRQRVTYALNTDADAGILPLLAATSSNPSSPLKERLIELRDLVLGAPLLTVPSGDIIAASLAFEGGDYATAGITEGDYVLVTGGPNRGFYPVTTVNTGGTQQLIVAEVNEYTTYALVDESGVGFEVYRGDILQDVSNQLVLFEYLNVLDIIERIDAGILMSLHDPLDLEGTVGTLAERPGDPLDTTLQAHRTLVNARLDRILNDSPNLRQQVEGLLSGREALYDIRYAWIDFRTNIEDGTLPSRERFQDNLAKNRRKQERDLTKLLSSE